MKEKDKEEKGRGGVGGYKWGWKDGWKGWGWRKEEAEKKIVEQEKKKIRERENEGERTTRETKTYLSQVTEGQKQRVTLEACDRAGSGKTCGKIQAHPPQSTPREREERRRRKKEGEKGNNKRPGQICYASG